MAKFDLYSANVKFHNEENSKSRPVLQIKNNINEPDSLCVITKHAPRTNYTGEVAIVDWRQAGLRLPSTARLSIRVSLPSHYNYIGTLTTADALNVELQLANVQIRERHIAEEVDDLFDMKLSVLEE